MCRSFRGGAPPLSLLHLFYLLIVSGFFWFFFFFFAKGIIGHQVSLFSFDLSRSLVWVGLVCIAGWLVAWHSDGYIEIIVSHSLVRFLNGGSRLNLSHFHFLPFIVIFSFPRRLLHHPPLLRCIELLLARALIRTNGWG